MSPDTIEKYHAAIDSAGPLLNELVKRGVSDKAIRKFRLGYFRGRITIPVRDERGRYVNLRRYLPGAPRDKKVINARGFGKERLFNIESLRKKGVERVLILGGEIKTIVADDMVGDSFACISSTSGEGNFARAWVKEFVDKDVWVMMDIDAAGKAAARRVAGMIAPAARNVFIVTLPLDRLKHPKGDYNDWVGVEGAGRDETLRLLHDSPLFKPAQLLAEVEKGHKEVLLPTVTDPDNVGWRLSVEGVISASDTTPYLVPKEIAVSCTRDQGGCSRCPVSFAEPDEHGFVGMRLGSSSEAILGMVNAGKDQQVHAIREALRIPKCKAVEFEVKTHFSVSDVRLTPQLTINGEGAGNVQQPALVVDGRPELNVPYLFGGKIYPHPRTQQATLVLDGTKETSDSLSSFTPTTAEMEALAIFRPEEDSLDGLSAKLTEVYEDFAANVTGIHGRQEMHALLDMAYHSPLFFRFRNKRVNGWVNILVMGDSAQGKSETTQCLIDHYSLGERVDLKNATVAGLLGGLQQLGNRWFVSWGVIPTHDKRIVILEEMKGAATEIISKLTDMRSSGIAEIPKIERRRAHARTRIVALSNPRGSRPMSGFAFGIEAVLNLVGALEDVRRFDAALIVAAGDVSHKTMSSRPVVKHKYTSELCRRLILWAWTRTEEQIIFSAETELAIEKASANLCEMFTDEIPLLDKGTSKHKVARLACAVAARTYSTKDGKLLLVEPRHVEYVYNFLAAHYSSESFGYHSFTRARRALGTIGKPAAVERYIRERRHAPDFVSGMLHCEHIRVTDIQDLCETDRDGAGSILSFLVRHRALRRGHKSGYEKTPQFISMLRKLDAEGIVDKYQATEDM